MRALDRRISTSSYVAGSDGYVGVRQFDLVDATARRLDRQVLVAENYFYKPLRRTLSRIVGEGSLGQIRLVEINAVKRQAAEGWRLDPALSARPADGELI